MRAVLRYQLSPNPTVQHLLLPRGAEILSIGIKPDSGVVSLWALCPREPLDEEPVKLWCVGTGWDLPDAAKLEHIGTAIEPESATVWHVFREYT
jgi:hypothetical protein